MSKLTGAEVILRALKDHSVDHIFGYPGGAVLPLYDELFKSNDAPKHILVRHEQGAAHAAEGGSLCYSASMQNTSCISAY